MQVVMWLVFAGSLGLAGALSHSRNRDRTNLVRVGPFELRVPESFKVDASGSKSEPLAHDTQRNRRLKIQSLPLNSSRRSISGRGDGQQIRLEFRTLNVIGVLDSVNLKELSDEGDAERSRLRARAAVPKVDRMVVITLDTAPENRQDEEDDVTLIEDIAAGLRIARDAGDR